MYVLFMNTKNWGNAAEVLGSNLSQDTDYPGSRFLWFYSALSGKFRRRKSIQSQPLPSKSFPIHLYSYVALPFIIT
jgi:hypothetical protein